jgi:ubiquinone/menaquinone biosynthesis C-methylase UbiE
MTSKFSDSNATTLASPSIGKTEAASLYDRIARLYNITFLFNRYEHSLAGYLRDHPLPLRSGARILDAGCGTGLLTRALLRALERPARIVSLDLSFSSLKTARRAIKELEDENADAKRHRTSLAQGNILALPFADETFDFVVTSGALEYVSLADGLQELARVTKAGGYFLHLPVHPSLASKFLEIVFRFKSHPPREVAKQTNRRFYILDHHRFPTFAPIGWTKTAILAKKRD